MNDATRSFSVAELPVKMQVRIDQGDPGGCWLWTGHISREGYGRHSNQRYTHRTTYELLVGPIPEGLHIDHLCRVRHCCNPAHLEAVTCRENILRGESPQALLAARSHCVNGHEFTPENTMYVRTRANSRICVICKSARGHRNWERTRAGTTKARRVRHYEMPRLAAALASQVHE